MMLRPLRFTVRIQQIAFRKIEQSLERLQSQQANLYREKNKLLNTMKEEGNSYSPLLGGYLHNTMERVKILDVDIAKLEQQIESLREELRSLYPRGKALSNMLLKKEQEIAKELEKKEQNTLEELFRNVDSIRRR